MCGTEPTASHDDQGLFVIFGVSGSFHWVRELREENKRGTGNIS